jgi:hypothetical protein
MRPSRRSWRGTASSTPTLTSATYTDLRIANLRAAVDGLAEAPERKAGKGESVG